MNPYDVVFGSPDLILFYAAVTLLLLAWAFLSFRYTIRWAISFYQGMGRWRGDGLPDKKSTNELFLLMVVWAINLFLVGGFVHVVV